jgi:raffinose/stachyose/melibiose transport system permease protein
MNSDMNAEKVRHPVLWTTLFTILSLLWIYPIVLVLINSFKNKTYIASNPFSWPSGKEFAGWSNFTTGVSRTNFFASFGWTVVITVGSVALILLCTSMAAWWIVRVNDWAAKTLYTLFLFNMIVPFQMVMYTLSGLADDLGLNTPWGLWIVYLGFGAGLAVFIFTGAVKGIPRDLEESAMIDGASVPRIFFQIIVPLLRPTIVSVGILETMWIWNDYLLPYLSLDTNRFMTISIAVQYLKGGYGSVDMGAMMACLVLAILPIVIFYLFCQKYIVKGVLAGAVKG